MTTHNLIFTIIIILTLFISCNVDNMVNNSPRPNPDFELRTEAEELDFMSSIAKTLTKNDKGYWEADFGDGLIMIYVPEGSFIMGNNDLPASSPEHNESLSHYWIAKTPVTIGQFRAFVTATDYITDVEKKGAEGCWVLDMPAAEKFVPKFGYNWSNAFQDVLAAFPEITINDNHPVTCISWNDAIAYTQWLAEEKGINITLPTEAEWEYAGRGNDGRMYPWGNEIPDGTRANYADETMQSYFPNLEQAHTHFGVTDGYALTSPVGSFPNGASPVGALDMVGNLNEWTFDSYYEYTASNKVNPIYTHQSEDKMEKSGDWSSSAGRARQDPDEIEAGHNIRVEGRSADPANSADDHLGFRVAVSYNPRT